MLAMLVLLPFTSIAQTPDWMFALEGTYVGRCESPNASNDKIPIIRDIRMDGLRNGTEDGFVVRYVMESEMGVSDWVEMWGWDEASGMVEMTTITGNQPAKYSWHVESSGSLTVLTRGGSENNQAVIFRLKLQRLPGQLRMNRFVNDGSGAWEWRERYILEEYTSED